MKTELTTPMQMFSLPQVLEIPLYQRAYVWAEEEQWEPLWQDIRRVSELRMSTAPSATHFLGAVVLQEQESGGVSALRSYAIVDGQQRLTTLQLLMDAAGAMMTHLGLEQAAARLENLTHNAEMYGLVGGDRLKVQHQNSDRDAFRSVMTAEPPVDHAELESARIVDAHRFFSEQVTEWLTEDRGTAHQNAEALVAALSHGLQLVAITLQADENSQEIFETLNARGTPLTAADLIKNLVFKRLAEEGADVQLAYEQHWRGFENTFWESEVPLGRLSVQHLSLFLTHWLVAQTGEEVSTRATFGRFKHWLEHECDGPAITVLQEITAAAHRYEELLAESRQKVGNISRPALFLYRTEAAGSIAVRPVLIRVLDPRRPVPDAQAAQILADVESWLVRRSLLSLPTSDISRTVAAVIAALDNGDPVGSAARVRTFLEEQVRPGTYWPGDAEMRKELAKEPVYRRLRRSRLSMALEAIEDRLRGHDGAAKNPTAARVERWTMTIEHLLPQSWRKSWPVDDLAAQLERDAHVHRLGNLTLLHQGLNSSVSDGPWDAKRTALDASDTLLLTRGPRSSATWDEGLIDTRTAEMTEHLIAAWPVPAGHDPEVSKAGETEYVEISVARLVAAGVLPPGTVLTCEVRSVQHRATVTTDGKLEVDGTKYDSPSGAAAAVTHGTRNGWRVWRLPNGDQLRTLKHRSQAAHAEGEA